MLLRLLILARASVELAEASVAVGDERAHAEFVSPGESLALAALGRLDIKGI